MTKNIKLLLSGGALVAFAAISLQGCSSSDDSSSPAGGTGGTSTNSGGSGGKTSSTGGTSVGGTSASGGKGGASSAGTSAGGASTGGTTVTEAGSPGTGEAGAPSGAAGSPGETTQAELCTSFCADEAATCGTDALKQYPDTATCMTDCAGYALGTPGDTTGNTLECRIYHVGAAAGSAAGSATLHCPHTGPTPTAFCVAQ